MEPELPWTEKYRPKKLDDVVGQQDIVDRLKAYAKTKNMPNLMFSGRAGIGKTASAIAMANELYGEDVKRNFLELNASVTPETPILVRKEGKVKRTNFGELADEYFSDDSKKYEKTKGLEILSMSQKKKVRFKPVSWISRHKVRKVARIFYGGGHIRTSLNHSVMVIDKEGKIRKKKVEELKEKELLVTFKSELEGKNPTLNFESYSPQPYNELRSGLVRNPKLKTVLENKKMNEDLAWLFGLYLAEGCFSLQDETKGQVIFTVGYPQETGKTEEIQRIIEDNWDLPVKTSLGASGFDRDRYSSIQARVCNTQLAKFMSDHFYDGKEKKAVNKRVPPFIYEDSIGNRVSFLKGYMGDAFGDWGKCVRYSSNSYENLIDISWLGRITGLDSSCFRGETRFVWKHPSFSYLKTELIPSEPLIKLCRKLGLPTYPLRHQLYHKKCGRVSKEIAKKYLEEELRKVPKKKMEKVKNLAKRLFALIESPLSVVLVKEIQIEDYEGYVYDVSVPEGEVFWGGTTPILLHNSDERGINVIRGKIKDFAATLSMGDVGFKIIFLDESDSMTSDAQNALRRTMEKYSRTCRFVLSCNYSSKLIPPIQSRCALFRFSPLQEKHIKKRLETISKKEKIDVSEKALDALVYVAEGDMRKAINVLQVASATGKKVSEDTVYKVSARARPEEVKKMIDVVKKGDFMKARDLLDKLLFEYALSGEDVVSQVYSEIVRDEDLKDEERVKLIDRLGEADFRISEGANERIQLEAFLAQVALHGKKNKK
jgi:replication factor C small subunit